MLMKFFVGLFVLLSLASRSNSDLASEQAALVLLRSSLKGRTLLWNTTQSSPCTWFGVSCDDGRVTVLRLPGTGLVGEIPTGIFGNLPKLRTLSMRLNFLSGEVPSDLGSCVNIRSLYLQGNRFSGNISEFLFGMVDLVRIDLGENRFTGPFSDGFRNLTRLKTLYLQNNNMTGEIPDFKSVNWEQFNVSNNQLNGSIPESLQRFDASSFLGNSLCGKPLEDCGNRDGKKMLTGGAIAGIVIGTLLILILIVVILMVFCRRNAKPTSSMNVAPDKHQEMEVAGDKAIGEAENSGNRAGFPPSSAVAMARNHHKGVETTSVGSGKLIFFGNEVKAFDLEDLLRASAEVLGKGTFGTAYKAVLEAGTMVAVKRLKEVTISEKEFRDKIELVGSMSHENLVPLRAYYYSSDEKLLVCDYLPMGSLSALLHGNRGGGRTPLNWESRCGIALGASRGIEYLHSVGSQISHGNIKSSNILLTQSNDSRVSDFGLAPLCNISSPPNRVSGYRAPEITDSRKVSQKADVYGFGVLLLELLTGKAPTYSVMNEDGVDLPRWVQSIVREEWTAEVFDLELLRYHNIEEEMVQLLQLGLDCAAPYPDHRPLMSEVTRRIEELYLSSIREDQGPEADLIHNVIES